MTEMEPTAGRKIYLIGICGVAMGSLAGMLKSRGYAVTGSDTAIYPPMSEKLKEWGIPVKIGYHGENIEPDTEMVIIGNVCRKDNAEALAAIALNIPYLSLPQALYQFFLKDKQPIVITGTHGKTTTASLMAWTLNYTGLDPGFMIGGITQNFKSNFRIGTGPYFVVEGDEYDTAFFDKGPKFLHYAPFIGIVNNIEFDHADIYPSVEEIIRNFARFIQLIPAAGCLAINIDDPNIWRLYEELIVNLPINKRLYGFGPKAQFYPLSITYSKEGIRFEVINRQRQQSLGDFFLPALWGKHNVYNALAVISVCDFIGQDLLKIQAAVGTFQGVFKRQTLVGEARQVTIIDDFAHHPSAVRETLLAMRQRFKDRRIWAIFEIKSNSSRRKVFQKDYVKAFLAADIVLFSPIFQKRDDLTETERISIPQLVAELNQKGTQAVHFSTMEALITYVKEHCQAGDVLIGMSGSDFQDLPQRLLAALEE